MPSIQEIPPQTTHVITIPGPARQVTNQIPSPIARLLARQSIHGVRLTLASLHHIHVWGALRICTIVPKMVRKVLQKKWQGLCNQLVFPSGRCLEAKLEQPWFQGGGHSWHTLQGLLKNGHRYLSPHPKFNIVCSLRVFVFCSLWFYRKPEMPLLRTIRNSHMKPTSQKPFRGVTFIFSFNVLNLLLSSDICINLN